MSRQYHVQIQVSNRAMRESAFLAVLRQQGAYLDFDFPQDGVLSATGSITLADGEGPDDAHERFSKALGTRMRSSWLYEGKRDWDHVLDDLDPGGSDDEGSGDFAALPAKADRVRPA